MELANTPLAHSIARAEQYPLHQDYAAMMDLAYKKIGDYSGELWTNYNESDPGITILENLCYALTELGSKADVDIANILAGSNNRIDYEHHFHTPLEIFPTNPVTTIDFCKVILNEIIELKQVYFRSCPSFLHGCVLRPFLELKPEYVLSIQINPELKKGLLQRVNQLFLQHTNLGQYFKNARLLDTALLTFTGSITIAKNEVVEKVIAEMVYAINYFLAPYPVYKNYNQLVKEGRSLSELLEGPFLSSGYLEDAIVADKRTSISKQEISAALVSLPGVEIITIDGLELNHKTENSRLDYEFETAPFVDVSSFLAMKLQQAGKIVSEVNPEKVNYYLQLLIPKPTESKLNELLPQGEFRNLKEYYSIQNSFPSIYRLVGKHPVDTAHQAKIKQLKAYLLLMEQYMGDYLAQLANIPQLFSFESGRSSTSLTSPTYFTQPMYSIPGAAGVLKGVKGYASLHAGMQNLTDWKAYQEDNKNPYALQLITASSSEADVPRKLRALEHLLARLGKEFSHQPLQAINPRYGEDALAEMEYLKKTLRLFPLLSANRSRSYFKRSMCSHLASGLERWVDNELGMRSYYKGVVECIQQSIQEKEGIEIYYYDAAGHCQCLFPNVDTSSAKTSDCKNWIEVIWNNFSLLSFPQNEKPKEDIRHLIQSYTELIMDLAKPYYGAIMLDGNRLLNFLSYRWIIYGKDEKEIYRSGFVPCTTLVKWMAQLEEQTAIEIRSRRDGYFEIGTMTSEGRWVGFCEAETYAQATEIQTQLEAFQSGEQNGIFSFHIVDQTMPEKSFLIDTIASQLIAFVPAWLSIFQQSHYCTIVCQKWIEFAPVSVAVDVRAISWEQMHHVKSLYEAWLKILSKQYDGIELSRYDRIESERLAFDLVESVVNTHTNTIMPLHGNA